MSDPNLEESLKKQRPFIVHIMIGVCGGLLLVIFILMLVRNRKHFKSKYEVKASLLKENEGIGCKM